MRNETTEEGKPGERWRGDAHKGDEGGERDQPSRNGKGGLNNDGRQMHRVWAKESTDDYSILRQHTLTNRRQRKRRRRK